MKKARFGALIGLLLLAGFLIAWALFLHNRLAQGPQLTLTPECAAQLKAFQKEVLGEELEPVPQPWKRMSENERRQFEMDVICPTWCSPDPEKALRSFYILSSTIPGRATRRIIEGIAEALQRYVGLGPEQAVEEALRIMGVFIATLRVRSKIGLMLGAIELAAVEGPIIFVALLEAQQYALGEYEFPEDVSDFFEEVLKLREVMQDWKVFMTHLTAAAAQAAYKPGQPEGEAALAKIARLMMLKDLYFKCAGIEPGRS
ncbi:MAG: hypothetical protein ACUVRH_03860 [Candidatus Bipolaricaulia bacterium]